MDHECKSCHQSMTIPYGLDPTDYCNNCAQDLLVEALDALKGLLARHGDGSEEQPWAEWDAASEVIAKAEGG